jgi:hypothetical protein
MLVISYTGQFQGVARCVSIVINEVQLVFQAFNLNHKRDRRFRFTMHRANECHMYIVMNFEFHGA